MDRPTKLTALALAAFTAACPGARGGTPTDGGRRAPDGGSDGLDGGTLGRDGGRDAGTSGCVYDIDCLGKDGRCGADGGCIPAVACDPIQGSTNCAATPYCWSDGITTTNNCYCHPADGGGLCYVQIPACGACTDPLDCGPASQVDNPGTCTQVGSGGDFCLPLDPTGSCPAGFVAATLDGGVNVCAPSCGACPCAGCGGNQDCPLPTSGVCNGSGVCAPPCRGPNDCPPGQVCHVLDKYLAPNVGALYAAGECGPPCAATADCAGYLVDGGTPLACEADDGGLRCRPQGCIADVECARADLPDASQTSQAIQPWCDIWSGNRCVSDGCRIGLDPFSQAGAPFDDCLGGYGCELPDGGAPPATPVGAPPLVGRCFQLPCYLAGGANLACTAGELCCGEGDAGTDCGGASPGQCYPEPNPPWCVSCDPSIPYFNPACAVSTTHVHGPTVCGVTLGIPATHPPAFCGPACDPQEPWTCPESWTCDAQPYFVHDCSACGANPCVDAGPDSQGHPLTECGCLGVLRECPLAPLGGLYEAADCAACPDPSRCSTATDDAGVNCLCQPGDGGPCPKFDFGGQSFSSACVDVSNGAGTFGCVAAIATGCQAGVCNLGHACTTHRYSCGWDGGT